METEALERPAELAVWPSQARRNGPQTPLFGPSRFASLREALVAASRLLADPKMQPWIVTEDGELLAPVRIRDAMC